MWPWISLERDSFWRWILRTSSRQFHNNPVLDPPRKPPDHVKDIYDGHTYDLKTRVDIWKRMDVLRHLTWRCGSFSLLLVLTSSGIMWFGVVLSCWYGLVFGPNWVLYGFICGGVDGDFWWNHIPGLPCLVYRRHVNGLVWFDLESNKSAHPWILIVLGALYCLHWYLQWNF